MGRTDTILPLRRALALGASAAVSALMALSCAAHTTRTNQVLVLCSRVAEGEVGTALCCAPRAAPQNATPLQLHLVAGLPDSGPRTDVRSARTS